MNGEKNPGSKLSTAAVKFIRASYKPYGRWNGGSLGRRFGVSPATVRDAVLGRTWAHV